MANQVLIYADFGERMENSSYRLEDQILEMYINNLNKGAPKVVHGHLRDTCFLNVARMLEGTKLDPPLISALIKRWRSETNTFYLLYDECTITLKDVSLQLSLSVDEDVITGLVVSVYWSATCEQLLGNVLNKFRDSWIKM
ncbi:hypothetical protein PVK06_012077 [Gossypium arboreum]|uniref:Aminotransferase-like plant mobile domain-containing protein n=1 Tax=Gossypium arboreum TaxID=29729 RepID=A0ABR0QAS3_GOSAR|nr:hypothetical protein PVK06_012077 [Gossypium arboreum]